MKRLLYWCAAVALLLAGMGEASAGNLIVNGGFETGDFTGWTLNGTNATFVSSGSDGFNPNSGSYFAALGNVGSIGTLSQTVSDTSGQSYTISLYLGSDGGTPNEFDIEWNGTVLYDQTNLPDTRSNASQYNLLTFTVTGTGSDTLTISERNDPSYLALDDVSVSSAAAPEPASLTLLGLGGFGVGGFGLLGYVCRKPA